MTTGISSAASKAIARLLFGTRSQGRTTSSIVGGAIEQAVESSGGALAPGEGEVLFHQALIGVVDPKILVGQLALRRTAPILARPFFLEQATHPRRVRTLEQIAVAKGRVIRDKKGRIKGFTPQIQVLQKRRVRILNMKISPAEKKQRLATLRKIARNLKKAN